MQDSLTVIFLQVECLTAYSNNPRIHRLKQIKQIARSIQTFGFINPILIDETGRVVAGHGRLLAAKHLGLKVVPCIRINYLSESEKRAYLLADNKLTENAGWDTGLLRVELDYLIQIDFDVELTAFSTPEIDLILGDGADSKAEPPPPPLPRSEDTLTRPGDIWQLGPHRVICGDCRDRGMVDGLMEYRKARMVVTDPPYNVRIQGHAGGLGQIQHREFAMASGEMSRKEFVSFLTESLGQLARVAMDGSLHYIFMDWRHMAELLSAGQEVYGADALLNLCVWRKTNGGMGSLYRSQHELVFVFKKGRAAHINNVELGKNGRYRTNVWDYAGVNAFGADRDTLALHPTVKPVRLVADAILDVSKRGDIVLDGFVGAGSTLLAAEQTGRVCYGIEIDPRYVDIALQRWMAMSPGRSQSKFAPDGHFRRHKTR